MLSAVSAGPAAAARAASSPATPVSAALKMAFEAARHVPAADVGGIRAGTLHTGSAGGREWAIASFTPARSAAQKAAVSFQDGAATGVFTKTGGTWRLVRTGLYGCGSGLSATLKSAWHLAGAAACSASATAQRESAQRALAALPAPARAAAKAARTARTAAGPAAASAGGFSQRIAAIALSQVGVHDTPAVTNFNGVDCDPFSALVAGFSANSDGCGHNPGFGVENENETWCSDFNKWVWEQAGITADMNTLNAGSVSFYDWAVAQGQSPQLDTGTPQAGDSVLFFSPGDFPTFADHVGVVTSVSSSGTIDMVNGDFSGGPDISAQYNTGITSLSAFAASVEGPGEEWVIVAPPATAQQPTPGGHMSGPGVAVAGTTGSFHASGWVPGGTVAAYYWTFGDGRTTNATGPDVTHAFSEPGTYTVSVTITSSYGTILTLERNVQVLAPSSGIASVPYDGIWYDPLPILQYVFTRSAGGLAVDSWDGGSWLQLAVPGSPAATGSITALSYPDATNADAMTPHAFYRAADGSLAETYQSTSGWVTQDLPGSPAAGGAIVATTTTWGGPAVFFMDTAGNLAESTPGPGGWATRELLRGGPGIDAASLALADTTSGTEIFAAGPAGTIRVFSSGGPHWFASGVPAQTTPGGSLAALTTPDGQAAVVYASARGGLAEATQAGPAPAGRWDVRNLPGAPAPGSTLAATTYLLPSMIPPTPGSFLQPPGSTTSSSTAEPLGTEAFFLTASGSPAVTFDDGTGWRTAMLPGTASSIAGASAYQVEEEPSDLLLSGAGGLTEETTGARSGDPSGTWTSLTLPDAPATWADQIVLYAADPADATATQAAAAAAGLPASQVITSFAAAWADALSGQYLVLATGTPAVSALFFNVCGWANPSALPAGSTPFSYVLGPLNKLPGASLFVNAASDTGADTQALATDLAYYALNGSLPPGVTSLPAAVAPPRTCVGSPS
ncbi:MAG TPA: PKD domain-containing protein [Streptosporangiaceae bacterium]